MLAQLSSEKLPPTADGNKHRDTQPVMQRARDFGTLSPEWDVHQIPPRRALGALCAEEVEKT